MKLDTTLAAYMGEQKSEQLIMKSYPYPIIALGKSLKVSALSSAAPPGWQDYFLPALIGPQWLMDKPCFEAVRPGRLYLASASDYKETSRIL